MMSAKWYPEGEESQPLIHCLAEGRLTVLTHRIFSFRSLVLVLALLLAGPAGAQSVVSVGPDRVSVHAENVPLSQLLAEFSEIVKIETLMLDPKVGEKPISLKLEDVAVTEAIEEVLELAEVNYTLWGGSGQPIRLFAGDPESEVPSLRTERPVEDPEPQPEPPISSPSLPPPDDRSPSPAVGGEPGESPPSVGVGGMGVGPGQPPPPRPQAPGGSVGGVEPRPEPPPPPDAPPQGGATEGGFIEQPPPPADVPSQGGVTEGGFIEEPPPGEGEYGESFEEAPEPPLYPGVPPGQPPFLPPGLNEGGFTATGSAYLAPDGAAIGEQPSVTQVTSTATILFFGLLLGAMLVAPDGNEGRRSNGE